MRKSPLPHRLVPGPGAFHRSAAAILCLAACLGHHALQAGTVTVVCNNNSGDATLINNAINGSSDGDEIVIDGPALITATIKLKGKRSYRGNGRDTVLKQGNSANLATILASDSYLDNSAWTGNPISVRHLTIDGNRDNNTAATVGIIMRSWLSSIEDVSITSMDGHGILLSNPSANSTPLSNTQVNGRIVGNFVDYCGGHGIYVKDTGNSITDWTLTDNWIAGSGLDGIRLENSAGWIVERNHIYGVPNHAIWADRVFGTSISDNYIEGFGETTTAGTWYGIYATAQGEIASTINGNRVFNFGGESQTGSTYRYIGIPNVNYSSGFVTVTGNAIRGAGTTRGTGLYYQKGSGTALTVISTGNLVNNVQTQRTIGTGVTVNAGL
ncbi:MAG TPA: hypothetical protein DCY13_23540 [Verrucomicrobiales bacterium]|nr:hypothetical protein [Verrucomicrobiales bacterium]